MFCSEKLLRYFKRCKNKTLPVWHLHEDLICKRCVVNVTVFVEYTEDGFIFVGYQFPWFSWRVRSTKSSTQEKAIFCMNYEGKYYGHEF